jgi:hypothetical protein
VHDLGCGKLIVCLSYHGQSVLTKNSVLMVSGKLVDCRARTRALPVCGDIHCQLRYTIDSLNLTTIFVIQYCTRDERAENCARVSGTSSSFSCTMATRSAHTAFGEGFERSAVANNQLLRPFVYPQDLNLLKRVKCEHGQQRSRCKECGGNGICEHGRRRSDCKGCGGSGICQHGR